MLRCLTPGKLPRPATRDASNRSASWIPSRTVGKTSKPRGSQKIAISRAKISGLSPRNRCTARGDAKTAVKIRAASVSSRADGSSRWKIRRVVSGSSAFCAGTPGSTKNETQSSSASIFCHAARKRVCNSAFCSMKPTQLASSAQNFWSDERLQSSEKISTIRRVCAATGPPEQKATVRSTRSSGGRITTTTPGCWLVDSRVVTCGSIVPDPVFDPNFPKSFTLPQIHACLNR